MENYERAAQKTAEQVDKLGKKSKDVKDGTDDAAKGADKASDSLDDMAKSADKAGDASDGLGSKLGSLVKGGLAALAAGVTAAIGAMVGSAEATREYRREMGKLDTAFTTNGHSADAATKTYQTLQGILGETDQAVEAANHLAKLTKNEEELARWTDVATGVYATFGASLPIENLTEAANETAKVSTLTGGLADALNWAGVNEEDFQAQLDACSNEQERQSLILETLNGLYSDAAEKYRETNAEVIRANEANEAWMAAMADVGGAIEPVLTDVKLLGASLVSDLVPGVQQVAEAFRGMLNGDDGAAADLGAALSGIFDQILTKVTELLPQVAEVGVNLITTLATSVLEMAPSLARAFMKILEQAVNSAATAAPALLSAVIEGVFGVVNNLLAYIPDVLYAVSEFLAVLAAEVPNIATQIAEWVPEIVTALVDALILSIPQLLHGAIQLLLAIVQAIPVLIEALAPEVVTIVDNIIGVLTESIPILIKGALHLFQAIIDAIPLLIEALVPQIPLIVNSIVQGLAENIPVLLNGALLLLNAIIDAIPLLLDLLIPQVPEIVNVVIDGLIEAAPLLLDAALELLLAIVQAIPQIVVMLAREVPSILDAILQVLSQLPELIWVILSSALTKMGTWVTNMTSKVVQFGRDAAGKAKTAAKGIFDAIVNGLKSLPGEIMAIGGDIVRGLWEGISDMAGWISEKIQGFGSNVLNGIKNFFGIASPSRVFRDEVGKMLATGLAEGIEKNAAEPLNAMADLSKDVLGEADAFNGLTLERKMQHTFTAPEAFSVAESGMLAKLDKILEAIERGQVLTIDGKTLVGSTAGRMDSTLGQRRALVARGAV
jgi:phage-related protein